MKPETIESVVKYAKIGFAVVTLFAGGAYTGHTVSKSSSDTAQVIPPPTSACPPKIECRASVVSVSCKVEKADPIKIEFVPSRGVK